jgi:FkbM family methyltransferase
MMTAHPVKDFIRMLCHAMGVTVHRVGPGINTGCERTRLASVLRQAARVLSPTTVIDVGAAHGEFTEECLRVFPSSRYLMIEPLVEYREVLQALQQRCPLAHYVCAAATSHDGEIVINVHPDLVGSSVLHEIESGTGVNGVPRHVPAVTLDNLVKSIGVTGPFLIKIDVQGAELDVLRGAARVLAEAEYVLCEVSLFKFFESGSELVDVVNYIKNQGFVPYDLGGVQYRPLDNALSQIDLAFVKESGDFRLQHCYATPMQRAEQDRQIRTRLDKILRVP